MATDSIIITYERMGDGSLVALHTHEGRTVAAIVHAPWLTDIGEAVRRWVLAGDIGDRAHRPKGHSESVAASCGLAAQALGVELGVDVSGWEVLA